MLTTSHTGQVLLARKAVENWPVWLVVNIYSVGLFAYKGLWLTALLYALFAGLSWVGWQAWRRLAAAGR
jgi:nicotinamide mononucleotide transporter